MVCRPRMSSSTVAAFLEMNDLQRGLLSLDLGLAGLRQFGPFLEKGAGLAETWSSVVDLDG